MDCFKCGLCAFNFIFYNSVSATDFYSLLYGYNFHKSSFLKLSFFCSDIYHNATGFRYFLWLDDRNILYGFKELRKRFVNLVPISVMGISPSEISVLVLLGMLAHPEVVLPVHVCHCVLVFHGQGRDALEWYLAEFFCCHTTFFPTLYKKHPPNPRYCVRSRGR